MVDQNGGKIYFIQIEIFFAEVHLVIYRNRRENKNFDVMGTLNLSANHAKPNLELVTPDSLHSSFVIPAIFKTMSLPSANYFGNQGPRISDSGEFIC